MRGSRGPQPEGVFERNSPVAGDQNHAREPIRFGGGFHACHLWRFNRTSDHTCIRQPSIEVGAAVDVDDFAGDIARRIGCEEQRVVSRLRFDAALYAPPPRRRPGQKGRPRRRGERLPALSQRIARQRRWTDLPLVLYGRAVTPRILTLDALWYGALRSHLVRMVVVRDPSGRRRDEAFFCTDLDRDAAFILPRNLLTALDAGGHLPRRQATSRLWPGPEPGAPGG